MRARAEEQFAKLTPAEKFALWMYLENAHEKESRIREELQHRSMEVPNYELFRKLHKTTSFMRLEFGGSEGVRPEWWGIVRELLSRDPVVEKRTVKRWPSLFVGAVVGLAVGIGVMLWLRGNHQEQTEKPTLSTDSRHADRLSATQREHLKGIFASLGHKAVEIRPGKHDRASKGYATELQLVFNDAGWNAQINPSGDGDIIELGDISGIAIVYKPGSDLARKVLDAFVSEGVAATGKPFDGIVSVDVIQILIGSSS